MRIYSDTFLRLSDIFRGKHVFVIRATQPAIITSKSPLTLLTANRTYYIYDNFARNRTLNHLRNYPDMALAPYGKISVWLPMCVAVGDRILIHETTMMDEQLPQLA